MLKLEVSGGIGSIRIARPEVHNAFNGELVTGIMDAVEAMTENSEVRVILLCSEGRSFCAGADLGWMKGMVTASREDNETGALRMGGLFRALNSCPKPVVARVQGAAIGGGLGLVSCADIVVASTRAKFGLSEVRLGLAPAVISPFVVSKIGESQARRYFLTGERFSAADALSLGLVHEVVEEEELDTAVEEIIASLLKGGPGAQEACKALAREGRMQMTSAALDEDNAKVIAALRVSPEGQEGLAAFFEGRAPGWVPEEGSK